LTFPFSSVTLFFYSPNHIFSSVGIIVAGAFVAGARDFTFDSYSYSVVLIENMCKALYLASVSRIGKISSFSSFTPLFSLFYPFLLSIWTILQLFTGKSSGLNIFGIVWCNGKIIQ